MPVPPAVNATRIVALAGAGLAKAVGLPAHHDAGGDFDGVPASTLARRDAWARDPSRVRAYYDARRIACATVLPSEAHEALARMQHALGATRCRIVTENIDEMLLKASAEHVLELNGSLFRLRCEADAAHPEVGVYGAQNPEQRCSACQAPLRPAVVWPGEPLRRLPDVEAAVTSCDVFLAIGTSASSRAIAALIEAADRGGARTIEINPHPTGLPFSEIIQAEAQDALPDLVSSWLE